MIKKIKLSKTVYKTLKTFHLKDKLEKLSFLKGRLVKESNTVLVTSVDQIVMPDSQVSNEYHVGLKGNKIAEVYSQILNEGFDVIINVHDHWFAEDAIFSPIDDRDDYKIGQWFQNELPKHLAKDRHIHSISMLISQSDLAARTLNTTEENLFEDIRIDIISDVFESFSQNDIDINQALHLRHSFLPAKAIKNISQTTVAIVGAGGLGAIALENALRTGFKKVILIDHDSVEYHNLNRLQGVKNKDIGKFKVEALKEHGISLFPDAEIKVSAETLYKQKSLGLLKNADLIIGALDCNDARWYLNRFSAQYLIPYFDAGVSIHQETKASVPIFNYRVNPVIPGACSCGHCSELQWFERKTPDAFLNKKVLQEKNRAGYINNQDQFTSSPAVYSINQKAVSDLFIELLNYFSGWPVKSIVSRGIENTLTYEVDKKIPEDCPICNFLLGQGNNTHLPKNSN